MSCRRCIPIRKPEITKKMSTPQNPPDSAAGMTWLTTTARTATARRPSMSLRTGFLVTSDPIRWALANSARCAGSINITMGACAARTASQVPKVANRPLSPASDFLDQHDLAGAGSGVAARQRAVDVGTIIAQPVHEVPGEADDLTHPQTLQLAGHHRVGGNHVRVRAVLNDGLSRDG